MTPRILLIALADSLVAARLPRALRDAGFTVGVLSDPAALVARSHYVDTVLPLRVEDVHRGRTATVTAAIAGWAPALVLPTDAEAAHLLNDLATAPATPDAVRDVLRRSLGGTCMLEDRARRSRTHAIAAGLGLAVVPGQRVDGLRAALQFTRTNRLPVALRTDRMADDSETALCVTPAALQDACARLAPSPGAATRAPQGRLLRALAAWRRAHPAEAAEPLPAGLWIEARPAGDAVCYTAAAMDGRIVAGMSICAPQDGSAAGLGTVVRVAGHAEAGETKGSKAAEAAGRLIAALGFTGLCGVHFIRAQDSGDLLFSGFTPYPTAVSHLGRLAGCDPCAGLFAAVTGQPAPAPTRRPATTVALFPQVWNNRTKQDVRAEHEDIPWEEGGLIAAALGRAAA